MDDTKFDLDKTAAALIFNADMSVELILPKMDDDATIDFNTNQNIFVGMAIASLVDDKDFRQFVGGKMKDMLESADKMREAEEPDGGAAPMCAPNSCPGDCCGPTDPEPCKPGDCEVDVTEGEPDDGSGSYEPDEGKDPGDGS